MNSIELVVFCLQNQEYGIDILCAQEIIRIPKKITKIPNVPSYVEGMFNLRGKVIPIIDLKKRFHFDEMTERSVDSRLLVLDLHNMLLGVIVDDVSEVLRIEQEAIEKFCSAISGISNNNISGICNVNERLILILDALKLEDEIFNSHYTKELVV